MSVLRSRNLERRTMCERSDAKWSRKPRAGIILNRLQAGESAMRSGRGQTTHL